MSGGVGILQPPTSQALSSSDPNLTALFKHIRAPGYTDMPRGAQVQLEVFFPCSPKCKKIDHQGVGDGEGKR